jgi:hypothetical protein
LSDGTTLLFGLPGVRVERVERLADGTRVVHVATAEETAPACPSCGVLSTSLKGRVTTSPRDIPYGEDRIMVRWNKARWRCREDYCERGSFTEAIAQIPARARTTRRLCAQIGAAIGEAARSVTEVAITHGVSWPTAHRAFVAHAEELLGEPEPTQVLGIDETRRGKPRWQHCTETGRWVRVDPWDTGFVDLAGAQGLLGQREGRTGATVIGWLSERSPAFREGIEYVAIDPAAAYASAVRTPGLLPNATLVVDHFHLVKLANDADQGPPPHHLGAARAPRPQDRPGVGQPAPAATWSGTAVGEELCEDVEPDLRRGPQRADPDRLDRQGRIADPAGNRSTRRRPTPDPAPTAPIPDLVRRLPDPRTAHPRHHGRRLVARD